MRILLKPVLIISFCVIYHGTAKAQIRGGNEYIENGSSAISEHPEVKESGAGNLKPRKDLGLEDHIRVESPAGYERGIDLSEYNVERIETEKYLASFRITELLWPGNSDGDRDRTDNLVVIGVKKPDYKISGNPYIKGKLDFRLGGSLFGIENRGLVTISYLLRTERTLGELSSNVSVERITFTINIPF